MDRYNLKVLIEALSSPMTEDQIWALCFKTTKGMRLFYNEIRRQPIVYAKPPTLSSVVFSSDGEMFCIAGGEKDLEIAGYRLPRSAGGRSPSIPRYHGQMTTDDPNDQGKSVCAAVSSRGRTRNRECFYSSGRDSISENDILHCMAKHASSAVAVMNKVEMLEMEGSVPQSPVPVSVDIERTKEEMVYDIGQLLLEAMRVSGRGEFPPSSTLQALLLRMTGEASDRPAFKDILMACRKQVKMNANIHYDLVIKDMIFHYVYGNKLNPKTGVEDSGNTTSECDDTARDASPSMEDNGKMLAAEVPLAQEPGKVVDHKAVIVTTCFDNVTENEAPPPQVVTGKDERASPVTLLANLETTTSGIQPPDSVNGEMIIEAETKPTSTPVSPQLWSAEMTVHDIKQKLDFLEPDDVKEITVLPSEAVVTCVEPSEPSVTEGHSPEADVTEGPSKTDIPRPTSSTGKGILGRAFSSAANYLHVNEWSKYLTRKGNGSSKEEHVETESTSDANTTDTSHVQIKNVPDANSSLQNIINVWNNIRPSNWTLPGVVNTAGHIAALVGMTYCYRNRMLCMSDLLHISMIYMGLTFASRPILTISTIFVLLALEPYYLPGFRGYFNQ